MRKDVALAMKDHYLSYYHKYDNGRLEELDIKKHGYDFMGHIKFLFDRTDSTLSITGDYGNGGALKDALNYIDDYWQEDAEMWGKQISGEIQVWAHALELGFRWKKPQEAPGQMSLLEGNGK